MKTKFNQLMFFLNSDKEITELFVGEESETLEIHMEDYFESESELLLHVEKLFGKKIDSLTMNVYLHRNITLGAFYYELKEARKSIYAGIIDESIGNITKTPNENELQRKIIKKRIIPYYDLNEILDIFKSNEKIKMKQKIKEF